MCLNSSLASDCSKRHGWLSGYQICPSCCWVCSNLYFTILIYHQVLAMFSSFPLLFKQIIWSTRFFSITSCHRFVTNVWLVPIPWSGRSETSAFDCLYQKVRFGPDKSRKKMVMKNTPAAHSHGPQYAIIYQEHTSCEPLMFDIPKPVCFNSQLVCLANTSS